MFKDYEIQKNSYIKIKKLEGILLKKEEEINSYKRIIREYEIYKKKEEEIRKSLDYEKNHALKFKFIRAQIAVKDPQNLFKTLILNKGSKDGVKKDQFVITYSNDINDYVLVGKIIEISSNKSKVMTLVDNYFRVGVTVEGRNNSILEGYSNVEIMVKVKFLDRNLSDPIDKEVYTSSLGDKYISGIRIGKIIKIEDKEDIFQTVLVKPYVNFFNINFVYLVAKENE